MQKNMAIAIYNNMNICLIRPGGPLGKEKYLVCIINYNVNAFPLSKILC